MEVRVEREKKKGEEEKTKIGSLEKIRKTEVLREGILRESVS